MLTRSKRQRNKEQSAAVDADSDASIRTHLDQSRSPSREPCTKSMRTDQSVDSDAPIPIAAPITTSPSAANPSASNPSASVDSDAPIPTATPITTSPSVSVDSDAPIPPHDNVGPIARNPCAVKKSRWFGMRNSMANSEDDVVNKIEKVNHFVWALCKAASEKTRWCGTNICGKKMYSLVYFEQPIDVNTFLSVILAMAGAPNHTRVFCKVTAHSCWSLL